MSQRQSSTFGRTGNPALTADVFRKEIAQRGVGAAMTIDGTIHRTALLIFLLCLSAGFVWMQVIGETDATPMLPYLIGGALGGLVIGLVIVFKKTWAPFLAPVYALVEGLFLGGLSALLETQFPGIVLQAVALTFGTLAVLLMAYKSGLIKATENFKLGVVAATGAVGLIYLVSIGLRFFGMSFPYIHDSGPIGIIFSLVVVVIAALNLVLDFDFIESGAEQGAPKYMEWYAGFGLLVTLIWLYIELLRLLAKLRSR